MTCTIFSTYLKKLWKTEPVRGNDIFIWWAAIQNTVSPDNNPVPYQSTDWLFYGWRPTFTKWGMTDKIILHLLISTCGLWGWNLLSWSLLEARLQVLQHGAQAIILYKNLMSAEFISGSGLPANAGILLPANLFPVSPLRNVLYMSCAFRGTWDSIWGEMDSETAGFLEYVL